MRMRPARYVHWLAEQYEEKLWDKARFLALEFSWLNEKYQVLLTPEGILFDAKKKYQLKASLIQTYKRPLPAMKRTMTNMVIDIARKLKQLGTRCTPKQEEIILDRLSVPANQSTLLEYAELYSAIQNILNTVPANYERKASMWKMYYLEGLKIVEIATIFGINHSNVSRPINAVNKYLASKLNKREFE